MASPVCRAPATEYFSSSTQPQRPQVSALSSMLCNCQVSFQNFQEMRTRDLTVKDRPIRRKSPIHTSAHSTRESPHSHSTSADTPPDQHHNYLRLGHIRPNTYLRLVRLVTIFSNLTRLCYLSSELLRPTQGRSQPPNQDRGRSRLRHLRRLDALGRPL